jgi:uncharacterized membrane protein
MSSSSRTDWQHFWHRGAVFSLLALILLCTLWELWVAPLHPGGSLLVLKVVPLLPAVPGVLRGKAFTFRWLSLLLWFYAAEGVTRALTDTQAASRGLGWIELLLSLTLFACVAGFLRSGASRHDVR